MIRYFALAAALVPATTYSHPGHGAGLHGHAEEMIVAAVAVSVAVLAFRAWRAR